MGEQLAALAKPAAYQQQPTYVNIEQLRVLQNYVGMQIAVDVCAICPRFSSCILVLVFFCASVFNFLRYLPY
jgi:hypothetical protein